MLSCLDACALTDLALPGLTVFVAVFVAVAGFAWFQRPGLVFIYRNLLHLSVARPADKRDEDVIEARGSLAILRVAARLGHLLGDSHHTEFPFLFVSVIYVAQTSVSKPERFDHNYVIFSYFPI